MANPAPTINQINAFNATQGTIIDFNIIGGTELVRSNKIYIYDLSDNSLICTHLYVSTESIHELPANTDGSIVYESGKSSADFVNGKQYYAQIQTFTDIAGTQGGSGLSVSKLFWCLVDPSLTIDTIPSSISTTSYNVSATYDANTSVVSNIIQQYQFNLYSATGSLLQSSGVIVGNGEQQGTSTAYDISYNFSGLSVGSSYYVAIDITTTQGMSVNAQSSTFTVSIDTPTLGEATVVNNACDGYISVTSNLSSEYGGSASGEIATFETDSVNNVTKLEVELEPIQLGEGTPSPSNVRPIVGHSEVEAKIVGKNLLKTTAESKTESGITWTVNDDGSITVTGTATGYTDLFVGKAYVHGIEEPVTISSINYAENIIWGSIGIYDANDVALHSVTSGSPNPQFTVNLADYPTAEYIRVVIKRNNNVATNATVKLQVELGSTATEWVPYVEPVDVEQNFNVTLTPTVIDETPYLFKKTGDVRGDRESLELVGGTVNWNQLMKPLEATNYAFETGHVTGTISNGEIKFVSDAVSYGVYQVGWNYPNASKKFLVAIRAKAEENAKMRVIIGGSYGGVKEFEVTTSYQTYLMLIATESRTTKNVYVAAGTNATGVEFSYNYLQVTDLTAFFGNSATADYVYSLEQANAGAGIAWLRKYFPDLFAYSPYNTGTLESVKPTSHVTFGQNILDMSKATNFERCVLVDKDTGTIRMNMTNGYYAAIVYSYNDVPSILRKAILSNTPITLEAENNIGYSAAIVVYGKRSNGSGYQEMNSNDGSKATLNPTFFERVDIVELRVRRAGAPYTDTTTVLTNLRVSIGSDRTSFEPPISHTYPITELELRGIPKLVDGELRFDGDTRKADGSVGRKFKSVVIDGNTTSNWSLNGSAGDYIYFQYTLSDCKSVGNDDTSVRVICDKLVGDSASNLVVVANMKPYSIGLISSNRLFVIMPIAVISNLANFRTWITNNPITVVYEKQTPTTETAEPFTDPQEVSIYGTEEFVSSNGVPVGNKTTYKTRDIFGGTIDLASGVLTVDRAIALLSGQPYSSAAVSFSEVSASQTLEGQLYIAYIPMLWNMKNDSIAISDCYEWVDKILVNMKKGEFDSRGSYFRFVIADQTLDTLAKWNAYLANNPMQLCYELATPLTYQLTPQQIETLIGTNNVWSNAGDVLIEFNIPITNLLVKRQDVDDVSGNWLTLYSQPVEQASDMDFTFIDFLNQYGKTYKYALVPLLTQTQSGVEVEVEGGYTVSDEVQSIFDGVYIGDNTGIQRLKAGVAYNNLNTNQQVGVIPTLGNKYPIVVSNSNIQYDTGSVSGLIVPDDFYSNGNLSRLDMSDKREVINDFLTNKKPKILKDWNGNIWLVVFTDNVDVSFDNNYGMGIATFTSGWTEVGDPTNQEDLQKTGLINVGGD